MFKHLFDGCNRKRLWIIFLAALAFSLCDCWFMQIMSKAIIFSDNSDIIKFLLLTLTCLALNAIAEFVADWCGEVTFTDTASEIPRLYLHKLYNIQPEILKRSNTGYISGLVGKLIDKQVSTLDALMFYVPMNLIFIGYYTIVLYKIDTVLGWIAPALLVSTSVFRLWWNNVVIDKRWKSFTDSEGDRNRLWIDLLSNINTIQKMKALDFADIEMKSKGLEVYHKSKVAYKADEVGFIISKYTVYSFIVIAVLIMMKYDEQSLYNIEVMSMLTLVAIKIPHYTRDLFRMFQRYRHFKISYEMLDKIASDNNHRVEVYKGDFEWAEIRELTYSYTDISNKLITINIPYFCVDKGDKICVHGESGQGKTTLLHILSKEIETHNVMINGAYVNERLDCVFVAQDTEMLDMSLRDNLTLGKNIQDTTLMWYLYQVGMGDWLRGQKDGLDTLLGERGVFVSTGQRQRLNLIRGLLIRDKELYLLDEPTSNVDEDTECKLIDLIKRELKNKTVVIITHRPAIMKICNKSYIFENGILRKE